MAKCQLCGHLNRTDVTQCEKCRGALRTAISSSPDSPPPEPVAAPQPGSLEADVLSLMQGQKKIQAIKLYRARTGVGLKEAKDFVEALAAKHGINSTTTGGCRSAALLMLLVAGTTLASIALALIVP